MFFSRNALLSEHLRRPVRLRISLLNPDVRKVIAVIGHTGTGKSTIINMLYNDDFTKDACSSPCTVASTADSVTKKPNWIMDLKHGRLFADTVGFGDPNQSEIEIGLHLKAFLRKMKIGLNCLILTMKFGRVSNEERATLFAIDQIFTRDWTKKCILVLTHYDGETDEHSMQDSLKTWIGADKDISKLIERLSGNVIMTDNVLGKYEQLSRPSRQNCLQKLKEFINSTEGCIQAAPTSFLEIFVFIFRHYFEMYRKTKTRLQDVMDYVTTNIHSGECTVCLEDIDLKDMAQTDCHHTFHRKCIKQVFKNNHTCPNCCAPFEKIMCIENNEL